MKQPKKPSYLKQSVHLVHLTGFRQFDGMRELPTHDGSMGRVRYIYLHEKT